jgi:hypothetical protein
VINTDVPFLFQLKGANNVQPSIEIELDIVSEGRWDQIKKVIKMDLDFDQDKTNTLWQVLESYVDVFAWHKWELG